MNNKKNIEKIFQVKLKDLEVSPNKKVWAEIETKLAKKKRRVFPFWWFSSGIAAIFILGLLIFPFSKKSALEIEKQPIIIANPDKKKENFNAIKRDIDTVFSKKIEKSIIVNEDKKRKEIKTKKIKNQENSQFIIADNNIVNTNNQPKDSVSKKAMKKIFLTDNQNIKNNNITSNKSKLIQKKNTFIIDSSLIFKNKTLKPKKDIALAVNEVDKKEKKLSKKNWSISPVFAVLNSNSFSNSSPLDKNLSNSTTGNDTYSYGLKIGYQINKKWTIQSGIHLQEIQFSNNQVVVSSSITNTSSVIFNSGENYSLLSLSNENFDVANISRNSSTLNGNLSQVFGYIEIPIEVKYNLLENKKIKTQIVTGFSSLFLNKNSINLNTNFLSKSGKASNLNTVNISGNFGLEFNYLLNKQWSLNLNPMLKAQLNTFNKNANNFKPYFIGIYTGINYQF